VPRKLAGVKVNKTLCETCPFNDDGCIAIRTRVQQRVLSQASQMCHGTENKTLCRGARDFQIQIFYRMGFLKEETDKCWEEIWQKTQERRAKDARG
jgi:hypothetical protein